MLWRPRAYTTITVTSAFVGLTLAFWPELLSTLPPPSVEPAPIQRIKAAIHTSQHEVYKVITEKLPNQYKRLPINER